MGTAAAHANDDALSLPLIGTRLVEASAGTGKTFTIATLYLRLILEHGHRVDEIVVATFTRAAAAELAERLRQRLRLACGLLGADGRPGGESAEADETRRAIEQAEQIGIARDELARRARAARHGLHTAMIGTLHSFCHRALAEFGFSAGLALAQPELVDDVRALKDEIVRDFWRRGSADEATAARLATAWGSPEELARQARDPRWRGRTVDPLPSPDDRNIWDTVDAARAAIADWDGAALARAHAELKRTIRHSASLAKRSALLDAIHADAVAVHDARLFMRRVRPDAIAFSAAELQKLKSFHGPFGGTELPAVQDLAEAVAALDAADAQASARLLRDARAFLEAELPRRLREQNLMSHDTAIDQLAAALKSTRGDTVAARLGQRWKAALIDEFQDTDDSQWTILRRLFGDASLIVVGDPKQAIYGFRGGDVYAWRAASDWARQQACGRDVHGSREGDDSAASSQPGNPQGGRNPGIAARFRDDGRGRGASATPEHVDGLRLSRSYRAGEGMCRAINALFSLPPVEGAPGAFVEPIDHPDLESAEPVRGRALLRAGEPIPALQLWWLDPGALGHAAGKLPSKAYVYAAVERACVAWIGSVLSDRAVTLRDKHGKSGALQPQHVAVLVNSNAEAFAMQAALARAGIAATCNLQASVYQSEEADDLALLLAAAANPDDLASARAARASILIGDSAAAVAATRDDDRGQAALLEATAGWGARLARHGPVAWLLPLLEAAAPRLLALADGSRRVANYLQLVELLQGLHAQSFGSGDLAARFGRARVEAAETADAERLRLDTDADAVTISTVHAAKGLEYDVVLLPYAVLGKQPNDNRIRVPLYWYHDGAGDPRVAIGKGSDEQIIERARREIAAEDIRRLYVGVTRAAALCVLPYGPTSATQYSAVHHLLQVAGRTARLDDCRKALEELKQRAGAAAQIVEELPWAPRRTRAPKPRRAATLEARSFARTDLERDWQVWSFSRLVRGSPNDAAPDPAPGAGDGGAMAALPIAGLAGPRFGTAVHAVLEATDFAAWRDAAAVPASEHALIETSLRAQGLPDRGTRIDAAIAQIGDCARGALNATLPCGLRLCGLAERNRRAEIEFHFALAPADTDSLYALLHRFHYQEHRTGLAPARLQGLMTGRIDLTFRHASRFHIIDWKTNLCAAYDDATLKAEIARHDYDLQWLVYTLALHRWLRQRLPGYDYDHHVGDVYYLFVRGMAAGAGVHVDRPPFELIDALDRLFQLAATA